MQEQLGMSQLLPARLVVRNLLLVHILWFPDGFGLSEEGRDIEQLCADLACGKEGEEAGAELSCG